MNKLPPIIIAFICLLFLTCILLLLTPFSRPTVTEVTVTQGTLTNASVLNQQIKISFSRPMNQNVTTTAFQVNPNVSGNTSWASNTLFFTPSTALKSDQAYRITITNQAEDIYHRHLAEEFQFTLHTQKASFLYINNQDQLAVGYLNDKATPITQNKIIKAYTVNATAQLVAYLHQPTPNDPTQIYLYNIKSGQTTQLQTKIKSDIETIQFNKDGTKLFFLVKTPLTPPIFDKQGNEHDFSSLIYVFDLQKNSLSESSLTQAFPSLQDFRITPDGNAALVNDVTGEFFLASLRSSQTLDIGEYAEYRGGTQKGDRLLFVDSISQNTPTQGITLYNGENNSVTSSNQATTTPSINADGTLLTYSYTPKNASPSNNQQGIQVTSWPDQKIVAQVYDPNLSFSLPKISPDNQYLAVEEYTPAQLQDLTDIRKYGEYGLPEKATLKFLNISTDKFIDFTLAGKELTWIQ